MTDSAATSPADTASRLCNACGLCCNGVLFHTVRLQPKDSPRELAALGLHIRRKHRQEYFSQPCAAYRGSCCAIYAQRPVRCRLFACRQLRAVTAGTISEADARAKIQEVQCRVARLDTLSRRADGRLRKGALSQRCETALAEPFDAIEHPELIAEREKLARGLQELDAILDAEFRLPPELDAADTAPSSIPASAPSA